MDIKFFYKNNQHSYKHEIIITSFADAIAKVIQLPPSIEVCLYELGPNVYGGIDRFNMGRFGINYSLSYQDIPKILVHELIHVNQKFTGTLEIRSNGVYYWHGIPYTKVLPEDMSYEDYQNLPWELDVQHRQSKVLQDAMKLLLPKT